MSASPYKFLNAYEAADEQRFFGRDLETDILVADVVVSRLVVLFAKTGTGKTSLIDAGVRPRLAERGYETYLIRTREDPRASARAALAEKYPGQLKDARFPDQLRWLVRRAKKPIVLFFDQFEEFFIYLVRRDIDSALEFVADVAEVYDDPESGVHLVFSLREEWFVDMGFFRDSIPAIYHNDANLRLRWFDRDQARAAIIGPIGEGVFEAELVDRLLEDLAHSGRPVAEAPAACDIEPAQLQIVCDTLWRTRRNGPLTLASYEALGDPRGSGSIAQQILDRRLGEEFERFATREELSLLTQLLPSLVTPEHTKWVREYRDLLDALQSSTVASVDDELVRSVIDRLQDARLVTRIPHGGGELVELTHDYLAQRLDELVKWIRLIWPRRCIDTGMGAWRSDRALLDAAVLRDVLGAAQNLALNSDAVDLVLRSSLNYAVDLTPFMPALEGGGADVWGMLENCVVGGSELERVGAIETLTRVASKDALRVLRRSLDVDAAAPQVVRRLGSVRSMEAIELLADTARRPALLSETRAALASLADDPADSVLAERARELLRDTFIGTDRKAAIDALTTLGAEVAVDLIDEYAGPGPPEKDGRDALILLAVASPELLIRRRARRSIYRRVAAALQDDTAKTWCIELVERVEDSRSADVLGTLARQPPLAGWRCGASSASSAPSFPTSARRRVSSSLRCRASSPSRLRSLRPCHVSRDARPTRPPAGIRTSRLLPTP